MRWDRTTAADKTCCVGLLSWSWNKRAACRARTTCVELHGEMLLINHRSASLISSHPASAAAAPVSSASQTSIRASQQWCIYDRLSCYVVFIPACPSVCPSSACCLRSLTSCPVSHHANEDTWPAVLFQSLNVISHSSLSFSAWFSVIS